MHLLSRAHYGYYCLISGSSKTSSTLSKRRVKMSHGAKRRETECLLDIGVRYPKDIPSPLCSMLSYDSISPDGPTEAHKKYAGKYT